jgi:Hemerythrin HHE cation binding domain
MTTIRQLIYSSPKKANELFAKLVDTSETAVKTRERLFSELKNELELQAELEEQHLFPVLKKHKETKGLVADALSDNRQTRKLLAELESTPKDSEVFGAKVTELQKAFQQHVRDEKKELLPAVVKALSDEEANTVVEKIEDEKAHVEAAQRADAKREREEAAAKREREQAAEANAAKDKAKADAERVQKATKVMRMATRAGADGASEMSKAIRVATGSEEAGRETDTASAMVDLLNEQAQHAMQATIAVVRARTAAEFAKAQSDFIGGSIQRMGQFNSRYLAFVRGGMFMSFPTSRR